MKSSILILILTGSCVCFTDAGTIRNGGFEQGLSNWQTSGYWAEIMDSFALYPKWNPDPNSVLSPLEGEWMLFMCSGNVRGDITQTLAEQGIKLEEGQAIRGSYFFATDDYVPWNDYGVISLIPYDSSLSEIVLAYSDINMVGNYRSTTRWINFKHVVEANETGTYTLSLKIVNLNDDLLSSYMLVDRLALIDDPNCDFVLDGDSNGDGIVNLIDYAELNDTPDGIGETDMENLALSWLIDCFETPENPRCVVWDANDT